MMNGFLPWQRHAHGAELLFLADQRRIDEADPSLQYVCHQEE